MKKRFTWVNAASVVFAAILFASCQKDAVMPEAEKTTVSASTQVSAHQPVSFEIYDSKQQVVGEMVVTETRDLADVRLTISTHMAEDASHLQAVIYKEDQEKFAILRDFNRQSLQSFGSSNDRPEYIYASDNQPLYNRFGKQVYFTDLVKNPGYTISVINLSGEVVARGELK